MNKRSKYSKRGELQTQETILAMFIFIIIIIIGMTVFFRYQENNIKVSAREFYLEQFSNKILTLPDTGEFVYTEAGFKKNSIDTTKLLAFQNLVSKKKRYYNEVFGYANITLYQVYPSKISKKCSLIQVTDCGIWEIYTNIPIEANSKLRKETPVSLYFPKEGLYTIGILSVEAYNV